MTINPLNGWLLFQIPMGRGGIFINMLQEFCFKILHRTGFKHINVDVLNQNVVDVIEDEDSRDEI